MPKSNKCIFCGKEVKGWGNNPWPLALKYSNRVCCNDCNSKIVIPVRMGELQGSVKLFDGTTIEVVNRANYAKELQDKGGK